MKYVCLIYLLLFSSCNNTPSKNHQTPNYDRIADEITYKVAKKIEAEMMLRLSGTGGGSTENHLRKLNMCFDHYGEISMEEARELLIYCVNEYLLAINANEEIRPNLIHYPFTPKNVEIIIYVRGQDRGDVPIGALSAVNAHNGKLTYRIRQPDPVVLKEIHEETYEESIKIIETQDPDMKLLKKNKMRFT